MTEVIEDRSVDEFELAAGRESGDEPWNAVHDQARLTFAFAQRILGALPLVDVRQQHAPANDVAACIAKRKAVVLEPTIGAVRSPESLHNLVWAARGDRLCEGLDDVRKVHGVNGVVRAPLFQFLQRSSRVFEDLTIGELDLTARRQERDQAWNAVYEQAGIALAFAQCFAQPRDFLSWRLVCRFRHRAPLVRFAPSRIRTG